MSERKHRFHVGQHVYMTSDALRQGLQGHARLPTGIVWRVEPDQPLRVWVQRAGLKGIDSYHVSFWQETRP